MEKATFERPEGSQLMSTLLKIGLDVRLSGHVRFPTDARFEATRHGQFYLTISA